MQYVFSSSHLLSELTLAFNLHKPSIVPRKVDLIRNKDLTMQLYLPLPLSLVKVASSTCSHNNCARAIMGIDPIIASSECGSFLRTTIIPPASTISITVTSVIIATTAFQLAKHHAYTSIPYYASNCRGAAAYSSACYCFGVKPVTITAPVSVSKTGIKLGAKLIRTGYNHDDHRCYHRCRNYHTF